MPLIVLEGPEGAGKTTQLARLARRLTAAGCDVVSVREPGGTPLGDEIRGLLLHGGDVSPRAEVLLFMSSRAHLVERVIRPALGRGAMVLADRFFLATYAYQSAGRGLPEALVAAATGIAVGDLRPDLTLLLSIAADAGLARAAQRGPKDRMESADAGFHRRVNSAFAEYATGAWQARHPEAGPIVTVDANGSPDEVETRVAAAVRTTLKTLGLPT